MLGTVLSYLVDHKLTTVKEIGEVTGRSTSTVYRWMNSESQPPFMDMRMLVRQMKNPQASQTMIGLLSADLPIVVKWQGDSEHDWTVEDDSGQRHDGHEIMDKTLLALHCLSDAMVEGHEAIRRGVLTEQSYANLITMVNDTIRHLTTAKMMLQRYSPIQDQQQTA